MKGSMELVPEGFRSLEVYGVYVNDGTLVILGEPLPNHDCDANGCGSFDHVLLRMSLSEWQAEQLSDNPNPDPR